MLRLAPFSLEKIQYSLRWTSFNARNEIIDAAKSSEQIFDIVSRPSLLYIVATLWQGLKTVLSAHGNITSAHIIDQFILHSYQRQAEKEKRLGFMRLTTSERKYFHEGLAVFMACRGATNQITGSEMEAAIKSLYISYPADVHISDQVIMEGDVRPLKARLDQDTAVDTITTDVRTHGVLVNDLNKRNAFRFAHKSFYELLFAKAYAYAQLSIEPIFYNALWSAMGGRAGNITQSVDILRFYAEIVATTLIESKDANNPALTLLDVVIGASSGMQRLIRVVVLMMLRLMPGFIISKLIVMTIGMFCIAITAAAMAKATLWFLGGTSMRLYLSIVVMPMMMLMLVFQHAPRYVHGFGRRWVAMLLCADSALGTSYVKSDLNRLVGRRGASILVADVCERWPGLGGKTLEPASAVASFRGGTPTVLVGRQGRGKPSDTDRLE